MTVLERILDLTHHVEEHVSGGRWVEAAAVEAERRNLMEAFVAEDQAQNLGGRNVEALRDVLERDTRTLARVHVQREALVTEFERLSEGARVAAAYEESSRERSR